MLLAGDAAGFVDPMTGDGLRFALRGGELAAEAALFELQTGIPAYKRLEDARRREFSGKWRLNRALRALVASPGGVRIAAAISSCWGLPVRYLIGVNLALIMLALPIKMYLRWIFNLKYIVNINEFSFNI